MIAKILIEGGFDVIGQAADGKQALEMAARLIPDVITLDVSMPGMSGLEALPGLRPKLPGAIIVMLTMNRQYEEQARREGADAYILKNRALQELIPAIRAACEHNAPKFSAGDTMDQLAEIQNRVEQARRRYAAYRREAKEISELVFDLKGEIPRTSDGTFAAAQAARIEKAAHAAIGEYRDALAELRRFYEKRSPGGGGQTQKGSDHYSG